MQEPRKCSSASLKPQGASHSHEEGCTRSKNRHLEACGSLQAWNSVPVLLHPWDFFGNIVPRFSSSNMLFMQLSHNSVHAGLNIKLDIGIHSQEHLISWKLIPKNITSFIKLIENSIYCFMHFPCLYYMNWNTLHIWTFHRSYPRRLCCSISNTTYNFITKKIS